MIDARDVLSQGRAMLGIGAAHGALTNVSDPEQIRLMAERVIPAAAEFRVKGR